MNLEVIRNKFEAMGARVKFSLPVSDYLLPNNSGPIVVDVLRDKRGEYFDIDLQSPVELTVLDVKPRLRHLLLMARRAGGADLSNNSPIKILCGHDEREWFAAQAPGAWARDVDTALEALKPELAATSQKRRQVRRKDRHRRKNKGYVRQGEWFFVPVERLNPEKLMITAREPIVLAGTRAGNKPHVAEQAYRRGGVTVYVHPRYAPAGLTARNRDRLFKRDPQAAKAPNWQVMTRDPELYVRGTVRHPDHKTIHLKNWHRVMVNRELRIQQGGPVAFLD